MEEFKPMERKHPVVGGLSDLLAKVQESINFMSKSGTGGDTLVGGLTKATDNLSHGFWPIKLPEGGSKVPVVVNRPDVNALGGVGVPAVAAGAALASGGVMAAGARAAANPVDEGEAFFEALVKAGGPKASNFWSKNNDR